ncbi:MAG: hypothetical protein ACLTNO_07705 [Blautia sp.]
MIISVFDSAILQGINLIV